MLCVRSASLISTTRISCTIAMIILRKFSACASFLSTELQLVELGNALNQFGDALAEQLFHILIGGWGVFDDVVQQCRHQRLVIETHFRRMQATATG